MAITSSLRLSPTITSLPKIDVNGFSISYADITDLQNTFKRLRKSNAFGRSFRYAAVSELGGKHGRPHFHVIFLVPKYKDDDENSFPFILEHVMFKALLAEWRRNYGSTRKPDYRPLCTYAARFPKASLRAIMTCIMLCRTIPPMVLPTLPSMFSSTCLRIPREVRLQQALKLNLDPDEYERIWKIVKPRTLCSLRFGLSPMMMVIHRRQYSHTYAVPLRFPSFSRSFRVSSIPIVVLFFRWPGIITDTLPMMMRKPSMICKTIPSILIRL